METRSATKKGSILERVQNLLKLSTSSNEHEAAAAAAEAQRLMIKHGIESVQLNAADAPKSADRIIVETGSMNVWYSVLANHVAKATFCTVYKITGAGAGKSTQQVAICGFADDIAACNLLLAWLAQEIVRLCDQQWEPIKSSGLSANKWKKSFRLGAVLTIGQRLAADRDKVKGELAAANHGSTALVRLETYEKQSALAVKTFLAAEGTRLCNSRVAGPKDGDGFARGREAGARISLNPPKKALTA